MCVFGKRLRFAHNPDAACGDTGVITGGARDVHLRLQGEVRRHNKCCCPHV